MVAPWCNMVTTDEYGRCFLFTEHWLVPFGVSQRQKDDELDWFRRVSCARVTITKDEHVVEQERREDEMADYARAQWDTDHRLTKPHKEERIGY